MASRLFLALMLTFSADAAARNYPAAGFLAQAVGVMTVAGAALAVLLTPFVVMGPPKPGDPREWPRGPAVATVLVPLVVMLELVLPMFGLTSIDPDGKVSQVETVAAVVGGGGVWLAASLTGALALTMLARKRHWAPAGQRLAATPVRRVAPAAAPASAMPRRRSAQPRSLAPPGAASRTARS